MNNKKIAEELAARMLNKELIKFNPVVLEFLHPGSEAEKYKAEQKMLRIIQQARKIVEHKKEYACSVAPRTWGIPKNKQEVKEAMNYAENQIKGRVIQLYKIHSWANRKKIKPPTKTIKLTMPEIR